MRSSLNILPILLFALVSLPQVAHAHLIGGSGLASSLNHPLFGLDHLLTMIAAGIIVTQIGGKAVWKVPATFVSFMVMGGLLAITGFAMPIAETGIALSVLAFGVFIALSHKILLNCALACVALFAIFHGHVHDNETSSIANNTLYVAGLVLPITVLHIMGLLMGLYARKTRFTLELFICPGAGRSIAGFFSVRLLING